MVSAWVLQESVGSKAAAAIITSKLEEDISDRHRDNLLIIRDLLLDKDPLPLRGWSSELLRDFFQSRTKGD
jgi:hypothetical protein